MMAGFSYVFFIRLASSPRINYRPVFFVPPPGCTLGQAKELNNTTPLHRERTELNNHFPAPCRVQPLLTGQGRATTRSVIHLRARDRTGFDVLCVLDGWPFIRLFHFFPQLWESSLPDP